MVTVAARVTSFASSPQRHSRRELPPWTSTDQQTIRVRAGEAYAHARAIAFPASSHHSAIR
jgi:hypothetical protein